MINARIGLFVLIGFIWACGNGDIAKKASAPAPLWVSPVDGKEMVLVPAGEFIMGTDKVDTENQHQKIGAVKALYVDQHPERKLFLDAYYIDKHEVTIGEYKRFLEDTGFDEYPANWVEGSPPEGMDDFPVTHITWSEALTYALWAGKRLPTEEQWEKAARGPNGSLYPWGNEYEKGQANIDIEATRAVAAVGSFPKDVSPYGALDMAGNVMEWTSDWYQAYPGSEYKDPRFGMNFRVLRGSSFQKAGHYFLDAYHYAFSRTEVDPDG